jgi:hypothetical protein
LLKQISDRENALRLTLATIPPQAKTRSQKQNEIINDPAAKAVLMGLDATITSIEGTQ